MVSSHTPSTPVSASAATRVARSTSSHQAFVRVNPHTVPAALPCSDYYETRPHKVGAMGNVVITDMDDLRPWLPVAQRVKAEVAEKEGGCLLFAPPAAPGVPTVKPQYYRIPAADAVVYSHASYCNAHTTSVAKAVSQCLKGFFFSSSLDYSCEERRCVSSGTCRSDDDHTKSQCSLSSSSS